MLIGIEGNTAKDLVVYLSIGIKGGQDRSLDE
jgi:hypothetical protein